MAIQSSRAKIVIVGNATVNELKIIINWAQKFFVLNYLTVLVYAKTIIHRSGGGWWRIFTESEVASVNFNHQPPPLQWIIVIYLGTVGGGNKGPSLQPPVSCIPSFWPFYLGFLPLDLFLIAKIILTSTSPASHPFRTPTSYPFLFCLLTPTPPSPPTVLPFIFVIIIQINVNHCLCLSLPSASISNEFSQKIIKCTHYNLP